MSRTDSVHGQRAVRVMTAAHLMTRGRPVTAQPPAAVHLTVVLTQVTGQQRDDRQLTQIRADPRPPQVKAAARVVQAEPVGHEVNQ